MGEQRQKYPREFKIEAVRRVTEGRETAAEVARALGIQANMLYGWVRQFKAESNEAFRGNGKLSAQDEEIRRLRRENADLREERDILKKRQSGSRSIRGEIRIYSGAPRRVEVAQPLRRPGRVAIRVLRVAQTSAQRT